MKNYEWKELFDIEKKTNLPRRNDVNIHVLYSYPHEVLLAYRENWRLQNKSIRNSLKFKQIKKPRHIWGFLAIRV